MLPNAVTVPSFEGGPVNFEDWIFSDVANFFFFFFLFIASSRLFAHICPFPHYILVTEPISSSLCEMWV
jgi:hypothetical protein